MYVKKLSLSLITVLILGGQVILGMEAPDSDQDKEITADQPDQQNQNKKKKKRKRPTKINFNELLGNQHDDPAELNYLLSVLHFQDELFTALDFHHYDSVKEVSEKIKENKVISEETDYISFYSPDGLAIVFQHKQLMPYVMKDGKKLTESQRKKAAERRQNWRYYPGVRSLVTSWLKNKNEDVRKIALVIQEQLEVEDFNISITKLSQMAVSWMDNLLTGKHSYILSYINDQQEVLKKEFSCLLELYNWYNSDYALFNPDLDKHQQCLLLSEAVKSLRKICMGYMCKRPHYTKLYALAYSKLEQAVRKEPSSRSYLKERLSAEKVNNCRGGDNAIFISFTLGNKLPRELKALEKGVTAKTLDNEDKANEALDDKDDWMPEHIKHHELQTKKQDQIINQRAKQKLQQKKQFIAKQILQSKQQEEIKNAEQDLADQKNGYFVSEADDYLEFADPKNNLTTRILKTAQTEKSVTWSDKQLEAIEQTDWVNQWYADPDNALEDQGYRDPKSPKFTNPDNYWKAIAYHTPALILKSYLKQLTQQGQIPSRKIQGQTDTVFTMPGVQYYKDREVALGKNWEAGIFAWIINGGDNKTNYHVEFRPTEISKMANDWLQKGYLEVNFPSLDEVAEYNTKEK